MRIDKGRKKRPAGVLCSIDSDSVDASVLVEERFVHVLERKWSLRCRDSVTRYDNSADKRVKSQIERRHTAEN